MQQNTTRRLFGPQGPVLKVKKSHLTLHSPTPLAVLSSAPVGGGRRETRTIVNRHVDKNYYEADPIAETQHWMEKQGLDPMETVGMLTAVWVEQVAVVERKSSHVHVAAIVTAGAGNAARAGASGPVYTQPTPGTINIILAVDGWVTEEAMINAVITVTEGKVAAMQELSIRDGQGRIATGTTTDAVVIASTQKPRRGYRHVYAGTASPLGQAAGQAVFEAVREALMRERLMKEGESW